MCWRASMAVRFEHGAAVLIESDIPEGSGVSSSAAIEAATMEAVIAAWPLRIEPRLRALRCQQVENLDRRGAVRRHGSDGQRFTAKRAA
jgi:galactokinase